MKLKVLTVMSCVFLLGISSSQTQISSRPHTLKDVIQDVFKNRETFDTVALSSDVTAQRLHERKDPQNVYADPVLIRCYDKDKRVSVSPDNIKKIQKLLQDPASYDWDSIARCGPEYGVLLNFRSGGRTVRVALCFQCSQIGIFDGTVTTRQKLTPNI
jgi:hypothetical protein